MKPETHAARHAEFAYDGEGIILRLVEAFPEFQPMVDAHLADNGDVLFHNIMHEVVETLGLGLNPPDPARLNAILTFFEHEAATSSGARNEIAVAFEHHPPCDEALTARLTFGLATSPSSGAKPRTA